MTRLFQIAALALAAALSACGLAAQGIYTKSQEQLPYRFFRVEADFEVKATGERIKFDYIAWCGGSVTHWRAGSASIRYNLYPEMMHIPTQDGAAIGIRTFNMCDEWTWENDEDGNSRIPDDLLPVVQWYPDVNDMGFAIGYESDAAYESPYSKLTFLGAKLSQTDAETWASWRKAYEAGFKPVGDIENPYYDMNTPSKINRFCNRASRAVIPPARMKEAEAVIPAGTGRYWANESSRTTEAQKASTAAFGDLANTGTWRSFTNFGGHPLNAYIRQGIWLGAMTRSGGGRVKHIWPGAEYTAYSEVFPVVMSLAEVPDKARGIDGVIDLTIPTSQHWHGFSFCGNRFVPLKVLEDYSLGTLPKEALHLPTIGDFNWKDDGDPATDDAIVRRRTVFRTYIDDQLAIEDGPRWYWQSRIYDRTGFMYFLTHN